MSFIVSAKPQTPPIPEGSYPAVCCGVASIGTQRVNYKGAEKEQEQITFCKCSVCSASSKTFPAGSELPDDWETTTAARRAADSWNRRITNAEPNY